VKGKIEIRECFRGLFAEMLAAIGPFASNAKAMGSFRKRRQNSVTSLPEPLGVGWQLAVTPQRPPLSRSDRLEPLRSSTRAPPRWPRPARPQQLGRRSSVISWEAPLSPARGTVARRNGFIQRRGGLVFGRPSRPQDRTQPAKLEIPFGHAFDNRGISLPKSAVCACARRSAVQPSRAAQHSGRAA
jgi:hypothetical protein